MAIASEEAWRSNTIRRDEMITQRATGRETSVRRDLVIVDEEIQLLNSFSLSYQDIVRFEERLTSLKNSQYAAKYERVWNDPEFKKQIQILKSLKRELTVWLASMTLNCSQPFTRPLPTPRFSLTPLSFRTI